MIASPATSPRDEPTCGRCINCHPGKQWGGDESCRVLHDTRPWVTCPCHKAVTK